MNHFGTFAALLILLVAGGCVSTAPTEVQFNTGNAIPGTTPGTSPGANPGATPPPVNVGDRAASLQAFSTTVYPLVRVGCINCHSSATRRQSPMFADGNMESAFDAIILSAKVNLTNPETSRIVMKLKNEAHNCWSGNCASDSNTMLDEIREWVRLAPPVVSSGIETDRMKMPLDNTALPAQTEYGTRILQAEQPKYRSEIISGRFYDKQDSTAMLGKFLEFSPLDANPLTPAARKIVVDETSYASCREFDATPGMKAIEDRIHLPSGVTGNGGKVINDGYKPFLARFGVQIIRPDRRLQHARNIYNANHATALSHILYMYGPSMQNYPAVGQPLPDLMQGMDIKPFNATLNVLPYFTPYSSVLQSSSVWKTSGSFTDDNGVSHDLRELFKEGSYNPDPAVIQRNFMKNGAMKKDILYKVWRELLEYQFFTTSAPRVRRASPAIFFGQLVNADIDTFHYPYVSVTLTCPNGLTCNNTNYGNWLNWRWVVNQSGTQLTQANALDCYTLNAIQTDWVRANDNLCTGNDPKYFHYIDLFVRPIVMEASAARINQTHSFYTSATAATVTKDLEVFNKTADQTFFSMFPAQPDMDLDNFIGGGATLSDADDLANFSATLYPALKTSRCVDCHNGGTAGAPQFVSNQAGTALAVLKAEGLINFNNPRASFRSGTMVHNCNGNSVDPRYSCDSTAEENLRTKLVNAITAWKNANTASMGGGSTAARSLTYDERRPGRAKYKFKVTESGLYNVWLKVKKPTKDTVRLNYRILDANNNPMPFSFGAAGAPVANRCHPFTVLDSAPTLPDGIWTWTTPGRSDELSAVDSRGYRLLDLNKQPLPLPNNRQYYSLPQGTYILDVIGMKEGTSLDAVAINRVEDMSPDSRLLFQPDRRAIDEKPIADYKRRVLSYDLSSQLALPAGKKVVFEIEAQKEFGNQNYIFRNPRFVTTPRNFNVKVEGIKVYINGQWSTPDATYKNMSYVTGDNRVLTFAPLVALVQNADDLISFHFDKLSVTNEALTDLFPKGNPPAVIQDRRCENLDYFVKNVKPILFSATVMLTDAVDDYIKAFPGHPRSYFPNPQTYTCTSCHNATHPLFKISTFLNDEELCREALSRVDFDTFAQSLVIRGINGTGNHPKFVFVERFVNGADDNLKVHDQAQDYMLNRYRNPMGIASEIIAPFMRWQKEDIVGPVKTLYTQLDATEKARIANNGQLRKAVPTRINSSILNFSWYSPAAHYQILHNADGEFVGTLSALDVIEDRVVNGVQIGRLEPEGAYWRPGPQIYDIAGNDANGLPIVVSLQNWDQNNFTPLKGSQSKQYIPNATRNGWDLSTIDHLPNTPATDSKDQMWAELERSRDFYREKVIQWIRLENDSRLANPTP